MYVLDIRPKLYKQLEKLEKLEKSNIVLFDAIFKKVDEILENPERYENLRAPLNHLKGVHIQKSFMLLFSVDKETKTVILEKFDTIQRITSGVGIDNINKTFAFRYKGSYLQNKVRGKIPVFRKRQALISFRYASDCLTFSQKHASNAVFISVADVL